MSIVIFLFFSSTDAFYTNLLKPRLNRHCHKSSLPATTLPVEEGKLGLIIILLSGLIFFLIFLGFIKGVIGMWCYDKIGMYGLNLLIELPHPLTEYEEANLKDRPVVYDIGGWPIHPDTLQRTVRVLPKRTEFCLNLVFFLAYPLAACVYVCAFCCCIKNLTQSKENACYKHVDVVRLTNHESKNIKPGKKSSAGKKRDDKMGLYVDGKEAEDTKYVFETLQKSKESIHEFRVNLKVCTCDDDDE